MSTGRQTDRQTDRRTDRQTDVHGERERRLMINIVVFAMSDTEDGRWSLGSLSPSDYLRL